MKSLLISILISCSFTPYLSAQADSVITINGFGTLYQYQNYFLGGQPSIEALFWLKDQGVNKIVNLRSTGEIEDYVSYAYNEEAKAKELGFDYLSIPVSGTDGYTPENLQRMDSLIGQGEKVLIHCAGAGRVRYFFIAYLVKYQNYSMDEAIAIGKQFGYFDRIEELLKEE